MDILVTFQKEILHKNYREPISPNLIYITEKYLFPVALRNVALIIFRKGFDQNGIIKRKGGRTIRLSFG